ncbi:MAG: alpha/beta hydrolase [Phycicoccus sp.]
MDRPHLTRRRGLLASGIALTTLLVGASAVSPASGAESSDVRVTSHAVRIPSTHGEMLAGRLYLPPHHRGGRLPAIVTANALSGTQEINLPQYAERFAAAGYATLIFDYRYWGASTGTPRYHVAPMEFRADISAALTYLTRRPEVDPRRIAGWGISMGGQNMLFQATWEPRFAAVAAVATGVSPQTDQPPPTKEQAPARHAALVAAARRERAGRPAAGITTKRAWCREPAPDCVLPVAEAYDFYRGAQRDIAPGWRNRMTSTSLANLQADDATFALNLARMPVLVVHPDQDIVPVEDVLFAYKRAPEPKRLVVPAGLHVSTYVGGDNLDLAAAETISWFDQHV